MGYVQKHHGKYRARYRDHTGQARSKSFTRKADADKYVRDNEVELERGTWLDPRNAEMTLGEWTVTFLSLSRRLAETTQQTYRRDLNKYILPKLGSYRIGRLPSEEVEEWLLDELDAGVVASSVHRHYRTLRRVLQVAVEKKKIASNPCADVKPPRVPRREMVFLSWDAAVGLAEGHPERYRALIYLAVDSGMRWSELVGLRRSRVDSRNGKVRVTEQLIRLESKEWIRKEPKSHAGVRSISISAVTAALLAEHIDEFGGPGPDGLVFANKAGNPLIASSFHTHYFKPALEAAALRCRFHDLRVRHEAPCTGRDERPAFGPSQRAVRS